jgi:hypothetical protein
VRSDRALTLAIAVYALHLTDEHFTGMWRDPLLSAVLEHFDAWSPRRAAYFAFQLAFGLGLFMTWLASGGKSAQRILRIGLGVALIAESHHLVRTAVDGAPNSGWITSLPMPFIGAWLFALAVRRPSGVDGLPMASHREGSSHV